jgi:peptidoglycan/LPS O-acetylase OafA/YrhL
MDNHRADIDGLRAIAVLLIFIFHLGGPVSGGFVGVDVFFVISGFLITSIIIRDIENRRFTFVGFYARRIRRIFPALLTMLTVVLLIGVFFLMPGDYDVTGRSALYAAASVSNFYFLKHTGYFDVASETMPLLHTWSLAIEEQFYLLWPATLMILVQLVGRSRRAIGLFVAAICATSLTLCIYRTQINPKAAFYLPHTRIWELDVGVLLAIIPRARYTPSRVIANVAGLAGLSLVLLSAFELTRSAPFPGYDAVMPVAGAALLVAPWRSTGLVQSLLSYSPFTFVGRISYSLYLWHWPIITLYRHYRMEAPMLPLEVAILAAVILIVSWVSWAFVEEPFRRSRGEGASIGFGLTATTVVGMLAFLVAYNVGFPQRAPGSERYASAAVMWDWNCPHERDLSNLGLDGSSCVLGDDKAKLEALLIGDSHAEHFAPLINAAAQELGTAVVLRPSCMPLLGATSLHRFWPAIPNHDQICSERMKAILSYIRSQPDLDLIILSAAWIGYPPDLYRDIADRRDIQRGLELFTQGFDEFFQSLGRPGLRFLVIGDVPMLLPYSHACLSHARGMILRSACPETVAKTPLSLGGAYAENVRAVIRKLPERWPNVSVVLPQDFMCDSDGCPTSLNGEFLYRDTNHIRRNLLPETTSQLVHLLHLPQKLSDRSSP